MFNNILLEISLTSLILADLEIFFDLIGSEFEIYYSFTLFLAPILSFDMPFF